MHPRRGRITGRRPYFMDLFGAESRRLAREKADLHTSGLVIGVRYMVRGDMWFITARAFPGWGALDVDLPDTDRMSFASSAERNAPYFVPVGPGPVSFAVVTRERVLLEGDIDVYDGKIAVCSIYPRRLAGFPFLRQSTYSVSYVDCRS